MLPLYYFLQKVRHNKQLPVDMNAIKDSLSSLTVPSQKAMFSEHMYVVNFSFYSFLTLLLIRYLVGQMFS